jgi:site-specific DNA-cytosine methylase
MSNSRSNERRSDGIDYIVPAKNDKTPEVRKDDKRGNLSNSDVGAPHKRERIWIVAYPGHRSGRIERTSEKRNNEKAERTIGASQIVQSGFESEDVADAESGESGQSSERERRKSVSGGSEKGNMENPESKRSEEGESFFVEAGGNMADSSEPGLSQPQASKQQERLLYAERGGSEISDTNNNRLQNRIWRHGSGKKTVRTSKREAITGCSDTWWKFEPTMGCMVDELPTGMDRYEGRLAIKSHERVNQLKGLGNSIVPKIAQILFEQIKPLL